MPSEQRGSADARRAADLWFLERGLPAVLRPGALVRRLWPRSAPPMAAFAVFMANSMLTVLITGKHTINIDGQPTRTEWFILALLILVLPLATVVGWRVSRIRSVRARSVAAFVSLGVVIVSGINSYVWLMASILSRSRLWLALLFLGLIAVAFITSATIERVRPMLNDYRHLADDDGRLAGTPFETMPDPRAAEPLSRKERLNVVFVCATSQVLQVGLVAIVAGLIFFVLGLILLSPELLAQWTRNGSTDGQILGMTLPIPQALIQTSMFLAALTFMYISARAVGDADYRARFIDPLIDDLRLTLVARSRYRAAASRTGS